MDSEAIEMGCENGNGAGVATAAGHGLDPGALPPSGEPVTRFATGAVRGTDASGERHDLLSAFAVRVVEDAARAIGIPRDSWPTEPDECVFSARRLLEDFDGSGDPSELRAAAFDALLAAHLDRGGSLYYRGDVPPRGLTAYAEAMALGVSKYPARNWEKGIPISDLVNHALRHLNLWCDRDPSEDHLGHAAWNLMSAIHLLEAKPELADGFRWYGGDRLDAIVGTLDGDDAGLIERRINDALKSRGIDGEVRVFSFEIGPDSNGADSIRPADPAGVDADSAYGRGLGWPEPLVAPKIRTPISGKYPDGRPWIDVDDRVAFIPPRGWERDGAGNESATVRWSEPRRRACAPGASCGCDPSRTVDVESRCADGSAPVLQVGVGMTPVKVPPPHNEAIAVVYLLEDGRKYIAAEIPGCGRVLQPDGWTPLTHPRYGAIWVEPWAGSEAASKCPGIPPALVTTRPRDFRRWALARDVDGKYRVPEGWTLVTKDDGNFGGPYYLGPSPYAEA